MNNVANEIGVPKPTEAEVEEVLNELDENKDAKLSFNEFKTLISEILKLMKKAEGNGW